MTKPPSDRPPRRALLLRAFAAALALSIPANVAAQGSPADPLYALDRAEAVKPFDEQAFARTFSHRKATVDGTSIHYVIGGRGPAVVLLHGWPETWYSWRRIMPALTERHTVIAVDLPGFGDSQAAPSADKRTVAARLRGLMRQIGVDGASLVGHDMGGPVAFAYASQYPDAVDKVVFMETAVPGFGFATGEPDDLLKLTQQSVGGVWHFAFFMRPDVAETLVPGREREFLVTMVKDSFYNPNAFTNDELEELTRWLKSPGGLTGGLDYYRALFVDAAHNREHVAQRGKLAMPVLVLNGGEGFLKNVGPASVRAVASDVTEGVVPLSNHFVAVERPGYLSRALLDFLGRR